jgi:3-methyladenine DNA glycosylase AlkD
MPNVDMKLKEILAIPEAVDILEKHLPGKTKHPQIKMALGMTLRAISKHPQAKISNEAIERIDADLRALD